ncbi:unnamed protein product, partial [Mesorhabditis belari]|uniref:Ubiquitin-like protease family profile domain-containing protein n=1 Tax=Mesorhabditis belari TaxID=2138241 RepID=A0AAF3FLX0_9BILA
MGRPVTRASYMSPPRFLDLEQIDSTERETSRKRRRDNNTQHIGTVKKSRLESFRPTTIINSVISTFRGAFNYFMPTAPAIMDTDRATTSRALNRQEIYLSNSEEEDEVQVIEPNERRYLRQPAAGDRGAAEDDVIFLRPEPKRQEPHAIIIDSPSLTRNTMTSPQKPSTSSRHEMTYEDEVIPLGTKKAAELKTPEIITLDNPTDIEVITLEDEKSNHATPKNSLLRSPKKRPPMDTNSLDVYKRLLVNDLNLGSALNMVPYQITQVPLYRRDGLFKKKGQSRRGSHLQRVHHAFNGEKEDGDDDISIVSTRDSTFSTPASFTQRSRSSSTSSSVIVTAQYFNDVENKFTSLNLNSSAIAARFEKSLQHRKTYDSSLIVELDQVKSARNEKKKGQNFVDELRTKLKISGIKIPIAKPEKKRLIDLPAAAEDLIGRAWNASASQTEVMGKCFGVEIMRKDLLTLRPSQWLNDEVINAFLSLLVDRSEKSSKYPKAYTFNTFFYKNIRDPNKGYKSVARWTRKVDIFAKEVVFVPVHLDVHWCMAIINMIEQKIEYYDSMAGYSDSDQCLRLLLDYLVKEAENKKKAFNPKEWSTVFRQDCPQQKNGYDCGVFSCLFAEYASRQADLTFTQADINYYRKRMAWEICNANMLES